MKTFNATSTSQVIYQSEWAEARNTRMLARCEQDPHIVCPKQIEKHIEQTKEALWRVIVEHEKKKLLK